MDLNVLVINFLLSPHPSDNLKVNTLLYILKYEVVIIHWKMEFDKSRNLWGWQPSWILAKWTSIWSLAFSFHKEVCNIWKGYFKNWGWKHLETTFACISGSHLGFDLKGPKWWWHQMYLTRRLSVKFEIDNLNTLLYIEIYWKSGNYIARWNFTTHELRGAGSHLGICQRDSKFELGGYFPSIKRYATFEKDIRKIGVGNVWKPL